MNEQKTALVVDDIKVNRECARDLLSALNYRVLTAEGYNSGLEAMREHGKEIDLVFLDINYPDGNGVQLLKDIQSQELDGQAKYIIATGLPDQDLAKEARRMIGENRVLSKPFGIADLVGAIESEGHEMQMPSETSTKGAYPTNPTS